MRYDLEDDDPDDIPDEDDDFDEDGDDSDDEGEEDDGDVETWQVAQDLVPEGPAGPIPLKVSLCLTSRLDLLD
jgi:hypothetical protein